MKAGLNASDWPQQKKEPKDQLLENLTNSLVVAFLAAAAINILQALYRYAYPTTVL